MTHAHQGRHIPTSVHPHVHVLASKQCTEYMYTPITMVMFHQPPLTKEPTCLYRTRWIIVLYHIELLRAHSYVQVPTIHVSLSFALQS